MAYASGKTGQVIFYSRNFWEPRRQVTLVRYYKLRPDLKHNNCAIIQDGGIRIHVDIKDLYRKEAN